MMTISKEELKRKLDRGEPVALLEALAEESYRRAHLPGALRVDLNEPADQWTKRLVPDKNREVVTYCMNSL